MNTDELNHEELDDILLHFGIKGMKWGVRRYQQAAKQALLTTKNSIEHPIIAKKEQFKYAIKNPKLLYSTKDRENINRSIGEKVSAKHSAKSLKKGTLSREEKKAIKKRKNDLLNEASEAEIKAWEYVDSKLKTTQDMVDRAWMKDEDVAGPAASRKHILEKVKLSNEYFEKNPSAMPKGMTIKYDANKFDGDDMQLNPTYTYNGKPVEFSAYSAPLSREDLTLFDKPKVKHSEELDDILLHFGIKGMKWGVRRYQKAGRVKKPGLAKRGVARVKAEVKSAKRERSWEKTAEGASLMTDAKLKKLVNRIRLENDVRRLGSRQEYLKRADVSTVDLKARVARLQLEKTLNEHVNISSKQQWEQIGTVVKAASGIAVKTAMDPGRSAGKVAILVAAEIKPLAKQKAVDEAYRQGRKTRAGKLILG